MAVPTAPVSISAAGSRGGLGLIPVLAFLSGLVLMALAGMGVLLRQRQSAVIAVSPTSPDTAPNAEPPPTPSP